MDFWKDGKQIEVCAIYGKGRVGQVVVLTGVAYGEKSTDPLAAYPQPSLFTINEKVDGKEGYYVLEDTKGNSFQVQDKFYGASNGYLYDAQEWLTWKALCDKEMGERSKRKLAQVEGNRDLLKDILIQQGVRVISADDAAQLGINDSRVAFTGKSGTGKTAYSASLQQAVDARNEGVKRC